VSHDIFVTLPYYLEELMYYKYLMFAMIVLIMVSCRPKENANGGFVIKDNIIYKGESKIPYTGPVKTIAEGKLLEYYVNNGLKNGEFKVSLVKGKLIMKGNIINGSNEGLWEYYYPSGEVETIGNFKSNQPDSIWTWYYPNGKIKEQGMFNNGLRNGTSKMFDENGKVSLEREYKNGVASDSTKK
jgi:antitoxin component YwqK of YwqJK toxin-antitoxin module